MKALYSLLVAALAAGAMGSASAADAPYVNAQTVRHAQKVLNDRGFRTGGVDGKMGPQTEAALVNFQRAEKLQPTGKLDRQTLAALGLNKADANVVRRATGFAIGGVPPVGHATPVETVIDEDLLRYAVVWAAAGTPTDVFAIAPDDLVRVTDGRVVKLRAM